MTVLRQQGKELEGIYVEVITINNMVPGRYEEWGLLTLTCSKYHQNVQGHQHLTYMEPLVSPPTSHQLVYKLVLHNPQLTQVSTTINGQMIKV